MREDDSVSFLTREKKKKEEKERRRERVKKKKEWLNGSFTHLTNFPSLMIDTNLFEERNERKKVENQAVP